MILKCHNTFIDIWYIYVHLIIYRFSIPIHFPYRNISLNMFLRIKKYNMPLLFLSLSEAVENNYFISLSGSP